MDQRIPEGLTPEEKAARKERVLKWLDSLPEFPACKFCGRVVLAGWCCTAALEGAGKMIAEEKMKMAEKICTCGMADLGRACKMTCMKNQTSSDCDVCHRPLGEHEKDGGHPRAWLWDRITDLESSLATTKLVADAAEKKLTKYSQQYTEELQLAIKVNDEMEQKLRDVYRWEVGFRNIVTILIGPRTDFEIKNIVEHVRGLKSCYESEKQNRRSDRQVILEHTDASAIVKKIFGLDKTDPMDDQLYEIAMQIVLKWKANYEKQTLAALGTDE